MTTQKFKKAPLVKLRTIAGSRAKLLLGKYKGRDLLKALAFEKKRGREL